MKRWLFENFRLKVLAVLIAATLWAYVDSRQVLEHRKMTLPVEVTDLPAGTTLDPSIHPSVSVLLVGNKETIQDLDPEDLNAVVSLKDYPINQPEIMVHPKILSLPKGVTVSVHDLKLRLLTSTKPADSLKKRSKNK